MNEIPTFVDVLASLANGLGVGAVLAFLFEHFAFFQQMSSQTKWWIVFGCSLGLPVLAQIALQMAPPEVWFTLEPYWHALAAGFLAWAGSQVAHKLINKR